MNSNTGPLSQTNQQQGGKAAAIKGGKPAALAGLSLALPSCDAVAHALDSCGSAQYPQSPAAAAPYPCYYVGVWELLQPSCCTITSQGSAGEV